MEERVAQLEKEVAELKGQVSAQPNYSPGEICQLLSNEARTPQNVVNAAEEVKGIIKKLNLTFSEAAMFLNVVQALIDNSHIN